MLIPAWIAPLRSSSAVPEPPCRVRGTEVADLISRIRLMARCFRSLPITMLLRMPCKLAHCGGKRVHLRLHDELMSLLRSGQCMVGIGTVRVNLRAATDVPNFSLYDH